MLRETLAMISVSPSVSAFWWAETNIGVDQRSWARVVVSQAAVDAA